MLVTAFVAAFALTAAACGPNPPPSATIEPTAARLNVTGSGLLCGPWWFGCGAVLVIETPGWSLPEGWEPNAEDTFFATEFSRNMERTRVNGIRQVAQDRIEAGDYAFVVVKTTSPDSASPRTLNPAVGCSKAISVPPGARLVSVAVEFDGGPGCSMTVSIEAAAP